MLRFKVLLLSLLFFTFNGIALTCEKSVIIESFNMKEIENLFIDCSQKFGPENVLGIWDVDMVLTQPGNPEAQMKNILKYYDAVKKIFEGLNDYEKQIALNMSTKFAPSVLVDDACPKTIASLMDKKIKMVTLTDSFTGKLNDFESVEKWREEELQLLVFGFLKSFIHL